MRPLARACALAALAAACAGDEPPPPGTPGPAPAAAETPPDEGALTPKDSDGDGLTDDVDCAPSDATLPSDWHADADGDGYGDPAAATTACEPPAGHVADATDCDDTDPAVHPAAVEICDGDDTDEDCSGAADDADPNTTGAPAWYADADADGFGDPAASTTACEAPAGHVADASDCDDADPAVHPDAVEVCDADAVDEDCSGAADDADPGATGLALWYGDGDGDGFGDPASSTEACVAPAGHVADATDCDDTAAATFPGAPEQCDGARNACDDGAWTDDDGRASLVDSLGVWADATAAVAAGSSTAPAEIALQDETLHLCAGTWSATVTLQGTGGVEGHGGGVVLDGAGAGPVFTATGGDATLRGLTLTGGVHAGAGGGVSVASAASLTVEDVFLDGNEAEDGGGLHAQDVAKVTLRRVRAEGNTATSGYGGGAAFVDCAEVALTDVEAVGNHNDSAFGGGGLASYGAGTTVASGVTLTGNTASGYGGGWSLIGGDHHATDLVVTGNSVDSTGGGLDVAGDLVVVGGTIAGNAGNYGGGLRSNSGAVVLESVALTGNTAHVTGSALHVASAGDATLDQCSVADNTNPTHRAAVNNNGALELISTGFSGTTGDSVRSSGRYHFDGQTVSLVCDGGGCR